MASTDVKRVALTLGDPRGIGPEIVKKVLQTPPQQAEFVIVGPEELIPPGAAEGISIGSIGDASDISPERAGMLTGLAVERAVEMAMKQDVDAIVTGPAEKHALHLAGFPYPGHTEWLGELAGGIDVAMMMAAGRLRVVLVTTHIALRDVPAHLTKEKIIATGRVTQKAMREWFGMPEPKIALCGLNPHLGENGLFGDEDDRLLAPAAQELGAVGVFPADTVFVRCLNGEFDAVLAPYHDVGMTAVKVAAFGRGVNITLGLPFVRTSPDHGTAFDIAGKGVADASSMKEAVHVAVRLAGRVGGRK